ncbi:MAG: phosphoribosylformylglycinamidine synthase [Defluviitaleaceae bacterium]|nr:phosphoribosylformylglycinamidine synthase [Defluviitaleaceae bacterium]
MIISNNIIETGVFRVFTERRHGLDPATEHKLREFQNYLGIPRVTGVRLLCRYSVSGMARETFLACVPRIFSDPGLDNVYLDCLPEKNEFVFAVRYLPGVFDQRADSAAFSCSLYEPLSAIVVETARVYAISGDLTPEDKSRIKQYVINPVDETEDKPFNDALESCANPTVSSFSLGMSEADKLLVQAYFRDVEKREPTETELRVLDTYWSDHCRHSTFLTELESVDIRQGPYKNIIEETYNQYLAERERLYGDDLYRKPICLMDLATICAKSMVSRGLLTDLDTSDEQNAASFVVKALENGREAEWLVMFKNETHNHPTEIEPYGGAATCLGGAIRDPLSGRSYVYQAMRVTGAADPRAPFDETIPGKLPQRKITQTAAEGFSAYGNQIGVSSGIVSEIYHPGYAAKRMEAGAVIGAARKSHVRREKPVPGDVVILVGGRTGRDGVGGATGSSASHTNESAALCGAEVQRGNPHIERGLQRLFRSPDAACLIKKCNDFGAGGVSVAVGELADGLLINLNSIKTKYEGLNGAELALSESQERMAVVLAAGDADAFIKLAEAENLEAYVIAEVTGSNRLAMTWNGQTVVDISRAFLDTNGARRKTPIAVASPDQNERVKGQAPKELKSLWLSNLSRLNTAAQKGLAERFDSTAGAGTVLMPFGGARQLTPAQVMAAKLPVEGGDTDTCTIMAYGYDPWLSEWSPFHGAAAAVAESVAKVVAAGGALEHIKLSFQEFFGKPGEDPERFGAAFAALLGAYKAQSVLKTPAIGGKDSMSGSFTGADGETLDVPPTLISFAVCAEKHAVVISPEFKKPDNAVGLLKCGRDKDGLPDFEAFLDNVKLIERLIREGNLISAYAIGAGGAAAAVSVMAFGNGVGVSLDTEPGTDMFDADYGGFVLELPVKGTLADKLIETRRFEVIGHTTAKEIIWINGNVITLDEALENWLAPLEDVFPAGLPDISSCPELPNMHITERNISRKKPRGICNTPRVLIPVFPGSNGEYDLRARFDRAGAETELFVIKNLSPQMLGEAIKSLIQRISAADIVAMPGGDENYSIYAAAMFRDAAVSEAVTYFMNERRGLMLGIGAGFHTLMKLGLLPYGEICDITAGSPSLAPNAAGRHRSFIARTMITSVLSPWFAYVQPGEVFNLPVSHGSGRFTAADAEIKRLSENGQLAAQYVDMVNRATMDVRFNPGGSAYAIEALTSPDGRVLGKMGHSERIGEGLYKNIPGNYDQKIFEAAVKYFRG